MREILFTPKFNWFDILYSLILGYLVTTYSPFFIILALPLGIISAIVENHLEYGVERMYK